MLKLEFTSKSTETHTIFKENDRICGSIYTKDRLENMAHLPVGYKVGYRSTDEFGNKYTVKEV